MKISSITVIIKKVIIHKRSYTDSILLGEKLPWNIEVQRDINTAY